MYPKCFEHSYQNQFNSSYQKEQDASSQTGRWGGGGGIPLEQPLALYDSFLVAVVKLVLITVLLLLCKPLRNSPLLYQPKMAAKHKTICRDQVL